MANSIKIFLIIVLGGCVFAINAQNLKRSCGESTDTLVELSGKTILCRNDTMPISYNTENNTSTLPNFAYIIEGPNGLKIFEDGNPPIMLTELGVNEGDTLYVSGFAYSLAEINGIIKVLSFYPLCRFIAELGVNTCQAISNINAQGGLKNLEEGLNLLIEVDAIPPIPTTQDIVDLENDLDSQASVVEGFCVAISNNGLGKDYFYIVERGSSVQQTINLNSVIDAASNHIAKETIFLDSGFYTNSDFYAAIGNCE